MPCRGGGALFPAYSPLSTHHTRGNPGSPVDPCRPSALPLAGSIQSFPSPCREGREGVLGVNPHLNSPFSPTKLLFDCRGLEWHIWGNT
jgi:hypothetical protein